MNNIDYADHLTIDQRFALMRMNEIRREKLDGWHTHLLEKWFPLWRIDHVVYLGSFTRSAPKIKVRWMKLKDAHNFGGGVASPADLARDYLEYKYKDARLRMRRSQHDALVKIKKRPPLMAYPCSIGEAAYVDVIGAYWSILKVVGWDVDYLPGKFISVSSDIRDFPHPDNKLARNSLITAGLPGSLQFWDGSKVVVKHVRKSRVNLMIWGLAMDVLNGLALDMERAGAVYAYTDGFIVDASRVDVAFEIGRSWGLKMSTRHYGGCRIHGVGNYMIGGHISGRWSKRVQYRRKLECPHKDWLRENFRWWAEYRGEI